MLTRFFLSLVWLLVASGAAAQSWHDDSRYVRLGPRSGYYIMRPGSHLSRQLGLEGAPISDTADPFRHGYGADAGLSVRSCRSIAASPAYVAQAQLNNCYISRLGIFIRGKSTAPEVRSIFGSSAESNNDATGSLVTTIPLKITGTGVEDSRR